MQFRARWVLGLSFLWALSGNAATSLPPLPPLPPLLADPANRILTDFQQALRGAEGEAARLAVLEHAFSELGAAFFQLQKRSYYQTSTPQPCAHMLAQALKRFQELLASGQASHLDLEHFRDLGMVIGMGIPPYENHDALERYRMYADLPTGPESTAVAQRLQEILFEIEAVYFPDTVGRHRNAEVPIAQARLRHLAIQLVDFIFIETRQWQQK